MSLHGSVPDRCILVHDLWTLAYPFTRPLRRRHTAGPDAVRHAASTTLRTYSDARRCRRDVSSHSASADVRSTPTLDHAASRTRRPPDSATRPAEGRPGRRHGSRKHTYTAAPASRLDLGGRRRSRVRRGAGPVYRRRHHFHSPDALTAREKWRISSPASLSSLPETRNHTASMAPQTRPSGAGHARHFGRTGRGCVSYASEPDD